MLTPECSVTHEHDHVQKLRVTRAPTGQAGMRHRLDRYVASMACTRNPLLGRDPIEEGVSRVDLASTSQLDLPPSVVGRNEDKRLGFKKEN
jgi:hypothetical protein